MDSTTGKISLIYPPISKQERYSSEISNAGTRQIPLGIFYLAAFMRSKGYDVQAIDAEAEDLSASDILRKIDAFAPDFIGISSTTVAFHRAIEVAGEIKMSGVEAPIILGGAHVTSNYNHAMSFGVFDYGVYGEGEITLWELCESLRTGKELHGIAGTIFREHTGAIIKNKPRPYIENLDMLPFPALDLIPDINVYTPPPSKHQKLPAISIISSRGCPGQCTFCDKNTFGNVYRKHSADYIFREIKLLKETYGVQTIIFADDTFLIDKKRIYALFSLLKEAGITFSWTCFSRINDVDEAYLRFLKDNGCCHIGFGIESGDVEILKTIKKNLSLDKARQVVKWCNPNSRQKLYLHRVADTESVINEPLLLG